MKRWHKLAGLYLLAGAGTAAWVYSKGYSFQVAYLVTWPMHIMNASKAAPVQTVAGAPRPDPTTAGI